MMQAVLETVDWTVLLAFVNAAFIIPCANALSQRFVVRPLGKALLGIKDHKKTDGDDQANGAAAASEKQLLKFEESGWKVIAYGAISCVSCYALAGKPFWRDSRQFWTDCSQLPCEYETPFEIRLAYACDMAYYTYAIPYALLYETKRKDMLATIVHHIVTVALIAYSYALGFTKVGVVIMFIHDICDVPLEIAKMARYAQQELVTNVVFAFFSALWLYMRTYVFPVFVLRSVLWEAHAMLVVGQRIEPWPHYHIFAALLTVLAALQVYWTIVILKILYKALFQGDVISDSRDPNDSDSD